MGSTRNKCLYIKIRTQNIKVTAPPTEQQRPSYSAHSLSRAPRSLVRRCSSLRSVARGRSASFGTSGLGGRGKSISLRYSLLQSPNSPSPRLWCLALHELPTLRSCAPPLSLRSALSFRLWSLPSGRCCSVGGATVRGVCFWHGAKRPAVYVTLLFFYGKT